MRGITPDLLRCLIESFSQGAYADFDPDREIGCQRENLHDLGYGWVYIALARVLDARKVLVVGSGRGFSAACFGLALEDKPGAEVLLVDPGFEQWNVEAGVVDTAVGLWRMEGARKHFSEHLGLSNVDLLQTTSDEAFERFRAERRQFDVVLVDGNHSLQQCSRDLRNSLETLRPAGFVVAHDAFCVSWPGVGAALEMLSLERPDLARATFHPFPGLALVQREASLLDARLATASENDILNDWRRAEGLTPRPLNAVPGYENEQDPLPEERRDDPNEGLFALFEGTDLVGGYGIRFRNFSTEGADDFIPADGAPASGYLRYGLVIRRDRRGRGLWHLATCELLRRLPGHCFFTITRYPVKPRYGPIRLEPVGRNAHYRAYRIDATEAGEDERGMPVRQRSLGPLATIDRLQAAWREQRLRADALARRVAALDEELRQANSTLRTIVDSRMFRAKNALLRVPGLRRLLSLLDTPARKHPPSRSAGPDDPA